MKHLKLTRVMASLMALASPLGMAASLGDTEINIGGYIKADVMLSHYSNGAPDTNSISRQSYIPGAISGNPDNGKNVVDFHARESRFNIEASNVIDGQKVRGFLELDFMVHTDGNERIDNGYSPRIRLAYLEYGNWMLGQNWSTFQNPSVLPDNLDFSRAADGSPFIRQGQIRYTNGKFQVALENPESTFSSTVDGQRITSGNGWVPDLVMRYNLLTNSDSVLTLSTVFRKLAIDTKIDETKIKADDFGFGASVAGRFAVGQQDDIRFTLTAGEGLGRYASLNFTNGASLDIHGETESIRTLSGFIAYRHFWTSKLRSSITLSGLRADNPGVVEDLAVNESSYSGFINLLYSPVASTTFGVELMHAKNTTANGTNAELTRMMFSAKFEF